MWNEDVKWRCGMKMILHKQKQAVMMKLEILNLYHEFQSWHEIVFCHFTPNLSSPFAIVFYSTMPEEAQNMISKALSTKTSLAIQENQFNVKISSTQLSTFSLIMFPDSNINHDFKLDQRLKLSKLNTYSNIIQHDDS